MELFKVATGGSAPSDIRYVPSDTGYTGSNFNASDIKGEKNASGSLAGALPIIALGLGAYFLLKK